MSDLLNTLEQHRALILLAEIGALIHDLGKLSAEFITEPGEAHSQILRRFADLSDPRFPSVDSIRDAALTWIADDVPKVPSASDQAVLHNLITQTQTTVFPDAFAFAKTFLSGASGKVSKQVLRFLEERYLAPITHEESINRSDMEFVPSQLRRLLNAVTWAAVLRHPAFSVQLKMLGDFVALHHGTYVDPCPELVRLLRAANGGADGFDSWIDKGQVDGQPSQPLAETLIATAFGYEAQRLPVGPNEDGLKEVRYEFAEVLTEELGKVHDGQATPAQVRACILKAAEVAFRQALGETRRAANDVTLWDHSFSVASLYKAALAKVLLEGQWTEPKGIGWRFLRVGVDGLAFFAQAHHVTDILGRRRALVDALDQVRQALEVDCPLGNEVYRDENGSVFVMPGLADENAHKQLAQEVEKLVLEAFRQAGLGEELVPKVTWNNRDKGPVRKEMTIAFGQLVAQKPPRPTPDPQAMGDWWEDPQARGKEICTVCGVRPIGYDVPKLYGPSKVAYYLEAADGRKVCGPCLDRRGKRAQAWVTDPTEFQRTIWTDEVADNNGRFALVVGRFGLEGWLDGTLVKTMLVAPGKEKNPSPARIRRCWDTTRQFWLEVVKDLESEPPEPEQKRIIEQRPFRLRINPANAAEVNRAPGDYHVYDWPLRGGITLSVVWVPGGKEGGYFLSADNLWYLAGPEQLAFPEEALKDDIRLLYEFSRVINGQREVALLEPSGYGRPAEVRASVRLPQEGGVTWHPDSAYTPYIHILAEPATFMALVPADRALKVAKAIKAKYDREMARVRDRLPLHLGLVFAPRRTPLAAVLEAGRAMLEMPDAWEEWEIAEKESTEKVLDDGTQVPEKAILRLRPASRLQPASTAQPDDSSSGDGRARATWHYPLLMGDGQTSDGWYLHLLVINPASRPKLSLEGGDFCRVDNLTNTVFIRPSRFDFEFLDTTARRFEIAYQTSEVSKTSEVSRLSRRTRPFLLDDLEHLENLWAEMCHLEKSQRHQVIAAIEAAREAWFGDDREGESLTDETFRQFVHDTLAGATWPSGCKWHQMDPTVQKQLEDAGVAGELADLAELHMQILKE